MRRSFFTSFIVGVCLNTFVQAQIPTMHYSGSTDYIQEWLLCGPFPNEAKKPYPATTHLPRFEEDFLQSIGGERSPQIVQDGTVNLDGTTLTWKPYKSDDSKINLDKAVSEAYPVIAYAYCTIESDTQRGAVLALGSNDGGRAWLNGEQVWDRARAGALILDEHLVPIQLKKGTNTLLLKIEERGISWGFSARLLPLGNSDVLERLNVFRINRDPQGKASIDFIGAPSAKKHIVDSASFTLVQRNHPDHIIWQHTWANESSVPIGVSAESYGEYTLRIENTLKGGGSQEYGASVVIGTRNEYTLFAEGESDYAILLGEHASESEQWAAHEMARVLKTISGIDFPVQLPGSHPSQKAIYVGSSQQAMELLGERAISFKDDDEGFQYENIGSAIVIRGGQQRGTMYGVIDFLERELVCRWYTPTVSKLPTRSTWSFDYLLRRDNPVVRVRNDFYYEAFDPTWAAHNRVNGSMNHRKQPGGAEAYWRVHTFNLFVPPGEFFDSHPEYFSLLNGKRSTDRSQLCLTNPDVLRIVTDRLRKAMREYPENLIYSVSQNDWHGACECTNCQAIVRAEGNESGIMIHFVNAVADAVKEEFPDKFVGTLAYQYTRHPPKHVKPRANVVVRLCTIECYFAHPLNGCEQNAAFMDDIEAWSKIAPHMYIWDYVVNFVHYLLPFPNFGVLQDNIQIFQANNAIGIMEQGAYQGPSAELAELRAYVIARLLWNPACDVDAVVDDFMYGYYGHSGQYLREYFDLLQGRVRENTHLTISSGPLDKLFSDDFVRKADDIFDQAEAVADDEAILHRVETARLSLMYLKCMRMPHEAKRDGTYERFTNIAQREGVLFYSESGAPYRKEFHDQMNSL